MWLFYLIFVELDKKSSRKALTREKHITINRIDKSLKFLNALGRPIDLTAQKRFSEFYVSHESLILDYEDALLKV